MLRFCDFPIYINIYNLAGLTKGICGVWMQPQDGLRPPHQGAGLGDGINTP